MPRSDVVATIVQPVARRCPHCGEYTGGEWCDVSCMRAYYRARRRVA